MQMQTKIEKARLTGILFISQMDLEELPPLIPTLTHLYCWSNKLTSLPDLPASLTHLYCGGNLLTSLPKLPPNLHSLYCLKNNIETLPPLPPTLKELYCDMNNLESLQSLQNLSLEILSCSKNKLTCIPNLPQSLTQFYADNNPLTKPFESFLASENPIQQIHNYYNQKRTAKNLLALQHTLARKDNTPLPDEIFTVIGSFISGKISPLPLQIHNLHLEIA